MSSNGLRFVSAASVSLEEYAALFTASFAGYRYPITFDAERLARRVRQEQHDLTHSLVAYAGARPVGVAALAVRGERGWVGGFGVVPDERGRGRGRALMSALVERARACGVRTLSLEVLAGNTAARALYERAGMRVTRDLLILDRPADYVLPAAGRRGLKEAPAAELLRHYWRLHAEPPAWQRELASLLAADLRGLYVGGRRRPRAYALLGYGRADGNTYLSDLAAADAAAAVEMCAALDRVPGFIRAVNEPERSPFAALLLEHGFREVMRQHEMVMEL